MVVSNINTTPTAVETAGPRMQQWQAALQQPRYTPPPLLPEHRQKPPARPGAYTCYGKIANVSCWSWCGWPRLGADAAMRFFDELEYPDAGKVGANYFDC